MNTIICKSGRVYLEETSGLLTKIQAIEIAISKTKKDDEYNYRLPSQKEFLEDAKELPLLLENSRFEENHEWHEHDQSSYFTGQFYNHDNGIVRVHENKEKIETSYFYDSGIQGSSILIKEKVSDIYEYYKIDLLISQGGSVLKTFSNIGFDDIDVSTKKLSLSEKSFINIKELNMVISNLELIENELILFFNNKIKWTFEIRLSEEERVYSPITFKKKLEEIERFSKLMLSIEEKLVY